MSSWETVAMRSLFWRLLSLELLERREMTLPMFSDAAYMAATTLYSSLDVREMKASV